MREAARLIAEDERLTPVLVPLGDGLLAAARDWSVPDEVARPATAGTHIWRGSLRNLDGLIP